jgi:hypothetical protein
MAESVTRSYFPSQVASDLEKATNEYGMKVGNAIESEWFNKDYSNGRYGTNRTGFHNLRLYARGEQSVRKYKDELSINGDLSYLNLDWKCVPIIPKFVDIVVNGISERTFDIKAYSQDPHGVKMRADYMKDIVGDMQTKEISDFAQEAFGVNLYKTDKNALPENGEELELHMQLDYKQGVELAEEQAINTILEGNHYELTRKRINYDLAVLGIGAVKNTFSKSEGAKVEYVDPADLVYSHTDSPYFDDVYYVGEVKTIPVNELKKQFPDITDEQIDNAHKTGGRPDVNKVQVLYFNYKTFMNEVYKVKETATGNDKAILKDDQFNPPEDKEAKFSKIASSMEVLYEGVKILGVDELLKWEVAKNMLRPKSDYTKVRMNYSICAPRMYEGRIESLVSRITGFADMIQLTHLKLQQVLSRMVPDGVYLDADGLAEVDLGNGTNYNPQEALNMFFQTGSVIGRSLTIDGDMNHGKVPIQEIQTGAGSNKISTLITTYNYYMQMIRDATGLNEARDGSTPDAKALVGVQKLAAANSNTATRHILNSGLFLTAELAEGLSLRISDILEYSPTKEAFKEKIGAHNVAILEDISELYLYDFGIFIELMPDEEEKALLENNIQVALAQQGIDLEDAIDVRDIRSLKLANQLLKLRRKQKQARDQAAAQQNIQAQSQANAQTQQMAAQTDVQKQQAITQMELQLIQAKAQFESQRLQQEGSLKKELMAYEFEINKSLRGVEAEAFKSREDNKEDRKDKRTKIQASQQSELINQRQNNNPPKDFESAGNDIVGGGFSLGSFDPR